MIRSKKGFTLIELVMVIVILGILAAVAIPRYIDLRTDALNASFDGMCGGLKASAGMLIASSFPGYPRGTLKLTTAVITNTDLGSSASAVASGTNAVITYSGATYTCPLANLAL